MEYLKKTLGNGARLIFTSMPSAQSVGINVFVGTGSRNETEKNNGLSHFLEHMVFKGTKSFPSSKIISEEIEGVGGVLNGYNSESVTNYWCKVLPQHFGKVFAVVSGLVTEALVREEEIENERGVILEEINRKEDNPQDKIFENINQITFPGHPLGWSTLGRGEVIKSLSQKDFLDYREKYYVALNIVVSVAGNIGQDLVFSKFEEIFGNLRVGAGKKLNPFKYQQEEPEIFLESKKTEQAYFCLSLRGLSLGDPDRYKLFLLNSVLGQGMSSRLFLNIREKGLAYFVGSSPDLMVDTGALLVYAGFNVGRIEEALKAVLAELKRLKDEVVVGDEFYKGVEKQKGPMLFQLEDPVELAEWYGKQEVLKGEIETEEDFIKNLEAVTAAQVQNLAKSFLNPKNLSLAIIGPYSKAQEDEFKKLLKI